MCIRDRYYLALIRLYEDTENSWAFSNPIGNLEQAGDYTISFCGKSYWHQSDEETEAQVENCLAEISQVCNDISSFTKKDFCGIETSEAFPNPTSDRVYVNLPDAQNLTEGTARIFDDCGKLVQQYNNLSDYYSFGLCQFEIADLASGLYFLDINLPELCESNYTRRIFKSSE